MVWMGFKPDALALRAVFFFLQIRWVSEQRNGFFLSSWKSPLMGLARARNASLEEVVMALKCGGHNFNNLHTEILLGTWVPALNKFESSLRRRNCTEAH